MDVPDTVLHNNMQCNLKKSTDFQDRVSLHLCQVFYCYAPHYFHICGYNPSVSKDPVPLTCLLYTSTVSFPHSPHVIVLFSFSARCLYLFLQRFKRAKRIFYYNSFLFVCKEKSRIFRSGIFCIGSFSVIRQISDICLFL